MSSLRVRAKDLLAERANAMMHYLKDLARLYACISLPPHLCDAQHGEVFLCHLVSFAVVERKRLSGTHEGDFPCAPIQNRYQKRTTR